MGKVISELVRRFDFEIAYEDDLSCRNVRFVEQENVFCRIRERSDLNQVDLTMR